VTAQEVAADRGWTRPPRPVPTRRVKAKGFRGDIEGLRGVAVLLVVFGHVTGWPRGGFVGVDVFFVISGFLITGLLVSEREKTGRISIRGFYARRVRRLMPAGVLVLVLTDLAASLLLLPSRAHETFVDSLWAFGFLANVHFAQLGTDYFSLTRAPSAVQHYWSLSVEEQFYVVWPALILLVCGLAKRASRRALTVVAGAIVVASLTWSVISTANTPASAYFSSPARAWELGAGALLVLLAPKRVPGVFAWLGAAGLVASAIVITPTTAVPGYALVLPVASTVAVLAAGGARIGLATPPIRYVGLISYSLYLWHWPVVVLGATVPGGTSAFGKVVLIAIAGVLSVLSYHLVEQPFRRRRPQQVPGPRRASVIAPAYAMVLIAALGATWVLADSPASRRAERHTPPPVGAEAATPPVRDLPAEIQAALQLSSWPEDLDSDLTDAGAPEWLHDKCLDIGSKNAARCTYGPATATRSVALIGDSVAVSWLPALRRAPSLRNARIHVLTLRQCANLRDVVSPGCAGHQDWALEQVRRLRPSLVVMSARYQGSQSAIEWRDGTTRMIAAVAPYTKKVVLLSPPPGTGNLQSCYTRLSEPQDCAAAVSDRWRTYAGAELQAATAGHAVFVDSRQWFCVADRCPAVVADLPVLFDGRHLTAVYAAAIAPFMAELFR
jgi:peptidoglycan/LPS O-acetylase OafA/YrhL